MQRTGRAWLGVVVIGLAASFVVAMTVGAQQEGRQTGAMPEIGEGRAATDRLAVLWTSGDPDVAHRVAFMYTDNAKRQGWFEEVRLIIWGPSQRLLAGDRDLQEYVRRMQEGGVYVQACIVCARSYGLVDRLRELGIEVKAMGVPLTEHIKGDWHVITF